MAKSPRREGDTGGSRPEPSAWVSVPALLTQELEDTIWKPNGRARKRSPIEGLMEQLFTSGGDDVQKERL